jgi:hypothetical protein
MLQVKNRPNGPLKITQVRKTGDVEHTPVGAVCSIEAGDGSDKPPC